jgi:hypothetical protein
VYRAAPTYGLFNYCGCPLTRAFPLTGPSNSLGLTLPRAVKVRGTSIRLVVLTLGTSNTLGLRPSTSQGFPFSRTELSFDLPPTTDGTIPQGWPRRGVPEGRTQGRNQWGPTDGSHRGSTSGVLQGEPTGVQPGVTGGSLGRVLREAPRGGGFHRGCPKGGSQRGYWRAQR